MKRALTSSGRPARSRAAVARIAVARMAVARMAVARMAVTRMAGAAALLTACGVHAQMTAGMDMDDDAQQHSVFVENLEGTDGHRSGGAWDVQAWYGGDLDKLWLKSEGESLGDRTAGSKVEALWAHAVLPFWDAQLGLRHDFGGGPAREWLAFGVQGISPYWINIEATGYAGDAGRTAGRLKAEYDLYLTQRCVLKPEIELNSYGKADPQRGIGAGLSDGQFEVRLRYEFTRGFAPYAGLVWDRRFGASATYARRDGGSPVDRRWVAGLQFLF